MKIDIADVKRVFETLVAHLEQTNQSTHEIEWDYYWDVPTEDRYNPYVDPKELNMGQLTDDWQELIKIADGDMPPVGPALMWLSSILRAIGESTKL
jgi:hypothetical protein